VEKKPRVDIMGLVMNFLGPGLLVIPSVSFLLVFIDIDCAYHVVPLEFGRSPLGIILRLIVGLMTTTELITTIGVIHLTLMTLIASDCAYEIYLHTLRTVQEFESETKCFQRCSEKYEVSNQKIWKH